MLCERCKHDVPEGARFCPRCGNEMPSSETTRVDLPTAVEAPAETRPAAAAPPLPETKAAETPAPEEAPPHAPSPPPQAHFQLPPTIKATAGWTAEVKAAWGRVGSPRLGLALGLVAAALLLSLISLVIASTASPFTNSPYRAFVWASFAGVLSVLALAAFAAARSDGSVWTVETDRKIGAALAAVAVVVGFVGVIVAQSANELRASFSVPAWVSFADVWAFAAFGWLVYTKPIQTDRGLRIGAGAGCAAVVIAIIGLAVGLGDRADVLRSQGWFGWATVLAVLAVAAVFGRRSVS